VDERKSRFCEIKNYCDRHYSYEMFVKFVWCTVQWVLDRSSAV
jgi:hypothetical protein